MLRYFNTWIPKKLHYFNVLQAKKLHYFNALQAEKLHYFKILRFSVLANWLDNPFIFEVISVFISEMK